MPLEAVVPLARHAEASVVLLDAVLQVIAHEQIEPAIAVVVDERRGHRECRRIRAAALRHVAEAPVAVVSEHLVWSEVRQVHIDAAIIVEVARRHPHAVAAASIPLRSVTSLKPQAFGSRPPESSGRFAAGGLWLPSGPGVKQGSRGAFEHPPLNEVEIEVTVVVIVEGATPGAMISAE